MQELYLLTHRPSDTGIIVCSYKRTTLKDRTQASMSKLRSTVLKRSHSQIITPLPIIYRQGNLFKLF